MRVPRKQVGAASPLEVQMHTANGPAAAMRLNHQAKAGVVALLLVDASGAAAIAQARQPIVLGETDIGIYGAVETRIDAVPS